MMCAEGTPYRAAEYLRSMGCAVGMNKWTNGSMNKWIVAVSEKPNGANDVRRVGLIWVVPLAHVK